MRLGTIIKLWLTGYLQVYDTTFSTSKNTSVNTTTHVPLLHTGMRVDPQES